MLCYFEVVIAVLPILFEDDHILAVNKPPRMISVPSEDVPLQKSVLGIIHKQYAPKGLAPYVLHRLDFATSGILLFGKNPAERETLESIFKNPNTHKKYIALIKGVPHGSVITKSLKARGSDADIFAQTQYKIIQTFRGGHVPTCSLVEAEIKTGRRHQVRKHFVSIGHPVILDARYGNAGFNRKFRIRFRLGRQFLHAASLSFIHPFTGKIVKIEASLPMDLQATLKRLHFSR